MRNRLAIDTIDIRDLLEELNIDYTERGKNVSTGWIGVSCPFCDDTSNHLGIHLDTKTISCFRCGETGNIIRYLSDVLNSFNKAITIIEEAIPRELRSKVQEEHQSDVVSVRLPDEAKKGLGDFHKKYLKDRRFNADILTKRFNLHSTGPIGRWANRIIIPVIKNYQLVTFTSCDISEDSDNRYVHLSEDESIINVKQLLFGSEFTNGNSVIVTEGLFDAWRFGAGAIPLWGTKFTDKQVQLLSKYNYVKVVGDGDIGGWKMNRDLATALAPFCEVKYFDLQEGLDPDKLSKEEVQHIKRR
jgi:DNA primase